MGLHALSRPVPRVVIQESLQVLQNVFLRNLPQHAASRHTLSLGLPKLLMGDLPQPCSMLWRPILSRRNGPGSKNLLDKPLQDGVDQAAPVQRGDGQHVLRRFPCRQVEDAAQEVAVRARGPRLQPCWRHDLRERSTEPPAAARDTAHEAVPLRQLIRRSSPLHCERPAQRPTLHGQRVQAQVRSRPLPPGEGLYIVLMTVRGTSPPRPAAARPPSIR